MNIVPTPVTAALAGMFSALAWPPLWARFGAAETAGTLPAIAITLLVIALPAHAFVVGFGPGNASAAHTLDTALLKRIGAWVGAAGAAALIAWLVRGA